MSVRFQFVGEGLEPTGPSAATVGGGGMHSRGEAALRPYQAFQSSNEVCEQPGKAVLRDTEVVKWDCVGSGLFKGLTQVTVTLDLLVRKTLREPYLAIFCEPPVPKR